MSRRKPSRSTSLIRRFVASLFGAGNPSEKTSPSGRNLRFESLEGRALMAADLASIAGTVTLGGAASGALIELYEDTNDNSLFEPSGGDTLLDTQVTDGSGNYRFDRLAAGDYFVRQPAQSIGAGDLPNAVSTLITIDAATAAGTAGTVIDDFDDAASASVTADDTTNPNSITADHTGVLGGERDMIVTRTSGSAPSSVTLTSFNNQLLFGSLIDAQGDFQVVYDGNDGAATTLAATGLGGVDLTQGGLNAAIKVRGQANQASATARLRVYTDATNYSDLTIALPSNATTADLNFYLEDFQLGTGAAGVATFTNVGAIDLLIETGTDGTDGLVEVLGAFRQNVVDQDFDNPTLDLVVTKDVDDSTPNSGQAVTFTMTVTNSSATVTATNVVLTDTFDFSTLSSLSTSAGTGNTFVVAGNNQSGVWTIPTLAPGATATLTITGNNTSGAQRTNTIALTSVDQFDTNTSNDTDGEQLTPNSLDLVVTKAVDDSTPNNGQAVTFTMTVTNSSTTDTATNVVLTDTFDFTTLSGLANTPETGTTFVLAGNNQSGVWTIPTLAPGATATLTITGNNTSGAQRTNSIALTSADQFDTTAGNNTDSEQLTPNALDLVVAKAVDDSTPGNGQAVTFTATVTNSSTTETATNVVLTDTFDFTTLTGVTTTAGTGNTFVIAGNNQSGVWTIPTLAPGATATLTIAGTNNTTAQRTNTLALTSADQFDTSANNNSDSETITPTSLDLVVAKSVNDSTPSNGQAVTFTVTVTNSSTTETATNVVLTDTFDFTTLTGVTSNAGTGNTFVLAGNNQSGVWTIPTLAPGATATLTIAGNNTSAAQRTNAIALTSLDQTDSNSSNNTDSEQLTPTALDLVVSKSVNDSTPNNLQAVTFTITVTNSSSTEAASNVVLTDTFDFTTLTGVTTSAGTGNTFVIAGNNQSGVWTIPTLAAGATATLTITGNNNSATQRTNAIALTSLDQFDTSSANDSDSEQLTPNSLDLVVTKAVNDSTPNRSQSVVFTMTVTNSSTTQTATNVVLTDTFDFTTLTGVTSNAQTGTTFVLAGNNQTGTWTIPTLAPGATATLTVSGNNNSAAQRTNTIAITSLDQFDTTTANNTDSEQLTSALADLSLVKTVNLPNQTVGQNVIFTVTVANAGPEQATGVQVTDLLPSGLSFVSATASQGSYVSNTGVWTVGSINSGANATLTITATILNSGSKINTARLTAADQFDPDSTPGNSVTGEDDQATTTVSPPALFSKRLFLAR